MTRKQRRLTMIGAGGATPSRFALQASCCGRMSDTIVFFRRAGGGGEQRRPRPGRALPAWAGLFVEMGSIRASSARTTSTVFQVTRRRRHRAGALPIRVGLLPGPVSARARPSSPRGGSTTRGCSSADTVSRAPRRELHASRGRRRSEGAGAVAARRPGRPPRRGARPPERHGDAVSLDVEAAPSRSATPATQDPTRTRNALANA